MLSLRADQPSMSLPMPSSTATTSTSPTSRPFLSLPKPAVVVRKSKPPHYLMHPLDEIPSYATHASRSDFVPEPESVENPLYTASPTAESRTEEDESSDDTTPDDEQDTAWVQRARPFAKKRRALLTPKGSGDRHAPQRTPPPRAASQRAAAKPLVDPLNEKRSTKSKCPPGLRSGKWTPEEEKFTNTMIHYFRLGLLDIEDGTSLRWYLSKKLNCEAMRVTKKLKGNSSIGKQIFRALDSSSVTEASVREATETLRVLEEEFFSSLAYKPPPNGAAKEVAPPQANSKRPKRAKPTVAPEPPLPMVVEDELPSEPANPEAELLLHFCLSAHRGEKRSVDVAGLDDDDDDDDGDES
ncbi:hypothetical protein SDRG_01265 [Saprolegnia diclina VS20]|uniref:Uncharacterized protein n=1 Tax=Saprolegnia diclina (strain VS20) TaxID=1156394 RepID=T0R4J8_SAPDV|nr:hypothetical protein SDRG_01265 [Saprolegnia diclina VS20]EQC41290.1 hypothetical protein SDRG_01265 [Saprolegnia diclina VS20]|eukprot:XP_008605004.1 hypothetical protein SDRG_01265 [Saprolegnia diclina VS20]